MLFLLCVQDLGRTTYISQLNLVCIMREFHIFNYNCNFAPNRALPQTSQTQILHDFIEFLLGCL